METAVTGLIGAGLGSPITLPPGKDAGIDNALAVLAPYNKICTQDLTGPNGPAAFYFPCID